jgi:hypothetical protein
VKFRAARLRGEETGLTDEERAFDDALAENQSARQVMTLRAVSAEAPVNARRRERFCVSLLMGDRLMPIEAI